eukprot:Skav217682  [mRNA]  locus=scaffold2919:508794:509873:+ [translate_table: standard]
MDIIQHPTPDSRGSVLREPFPARFSEQWSFLRPYTDIDVAPVHPPQGLPVFEDDQGDRHLIVAHLYSGRRRAGDCHEVAYKIFQTYFPGFSLHFLSVDTAIHPEYGNLTAQGYDSLMQLVQLGGLALVLSGPPCETWSAARWLEIPDMPAAPRPLRTSERPWGVHGLTLREAKQLATGTTLLLRSMRVEISAILEGASGLTEHPAPAEDPKPSIWKVALNTKYMQALPDYRLHSFNQINYGAAAVKPTVFRVARLKSFSKCFSALASPGTAVPAQHLQGFDHFSKQFRTSSAKEYPGPLCTAMITAAFQCLSDRHRIEGLKVIPFDRIPATVRAWMSQLETSSQSFGTTFLADYQPQRA